MVYFQVLLLLVSREKNHPWCPLYPPINCDKSSTSSSSSLLFNRFPNFWYWLVVPAHPKNISQIRKSSPSRDENKKYLKPPPTGYPSGPDSNTSSTYATTSNLVRGVFEHRQMTMPYPPDHPKNLRVSKSIKRQKNTIFFQNPKNPDPSLKFVGSILSQNPIYPGPRNMPGKSRIFN